MSRNSSGVYTLPQAAFVVNNVISSSAVNSNFSDIATALTQSMATTGVSTMTAPVPLFQGTVGKPSLTFAGSLTSGFYLNNTTTGVWGVSISGVLAISQDANINMQTGYNITDKNTNLVFAMPFGTISPYGGSTAPTGWLLCFGQTVSRTTYANLYTAIGTTYGAGDGTTTFGIPDLRGRVPFGKDNMGGTAASRITTAGSGVDGTTLASTGGAQNVTISQAQLPSYTLSLTDPTHTHSYTLNSNAVAQYGGSGGTPLYTITGGTTGSTADGVSFTSGGSGTALTTIQPALIVTYIIYTGV